MTEQQKKLHELTVRRRGVIEEATRLQKELQQRSELLMRLEGALEAFAMLDIKLPEEGVEG
jgi:hypothetical protein